MSQTMQERNSGCEKKERPCSCGLESDFQTVSTNFAQEISCCGSPVQPESAPFERPGYTLCRFVESFIDTPVGPVPRVKTFLDRPDVFGTILARLGIGRNRYKVSPGLYGVGSPGPDSPVLVTANYKLTVDTLRKNLTGASAWILVLDTRGINVWCAAGKGTFSTTEVVRRVKLSGLDKVVCHRKLILPQLSATGVLAHQVKKDCGFQVIWGPIRADDIQRFLDAEMKADISMRRVTFSFAERLVLVPVELSELPKPTLWILLAVFILSGIGPNIFSLSASWSRGLAAAASYGAGIFAGAIVTPVLLPWIPGRAFSFKGAITGLIIGLGTVSMFWNQTSRLEDLALLLCTASISSYLAMNFTGATPFTSPSGVEKEMRRAIPVQAGALLVAAIAWVGSAFAG